MVSDERAISQTEGPETGQTQKARGHFWVEKFCAVPPCAGMNPSGDHYRESRTPHASLFSYNDVKLLTLMR